MYLLKCAFALLLLLLPCRGYPQPAPFVVSEADPAKNIRPYCLLYFGTDKTPRPEKFFSDELKPLHENGDRGKHITGFTKHEGGFWVFFEAINNKPDTITTYFYFGRFLNSHLYSFNVLTNRLEESDLKKIFLKNRDFIFPVTFLPHSHYRLAVFMSEDNNASGTRIFFVAGTGSQNIRSLIADNSGYTQEERMLTINASFMLQGFLICILLFSLVYFFLTGKQVFAWYFLYILTTLFYYAHRHYEIQNTRLFWYQVAFLKDLTWQPLSYLFYYLFAIHFVDYKKLDPRLLRFIKWIIAVLSIYLIADLTLHILHEYVLRNRLYDYFRYVTGVPALICIIWSWMLKDKLARILAAGSMFMVVGALVTMIFASVFKNTGNPWLDYHMIYMYIGTATETLFFAMGLSYKNRLADIAQREMEIELSREKQEREALRLRTIIETQEQERERVAFELHDDLGSGLTSIRMLSQMAMSGNETKSYLEKIYRIAGEVIDNMRQIIWTMDPANSNLAELTRRIKVYADDFLETAGLRLVFKGSNDLPATKLNSRHVRNIFLVIKECLNNIVKHASATMVTFEVSFTDNDLRITIHDNGKGISENNDEALQHGMKSINKRMKEIEGRIYFTSNNGTTVHIEVKING
jgi:signal transduction histidine kinase